MKSDKKIAIMATAIMVILIALAGTITIVSADDIALGSMGQLEVTPKSTETSGKTIDMGPVFASDFYEYYVTKNFSLFPGYNWVNAVRIAAQVDGTTVYIDENCNDIADWVIDMDEGDNWEAELPTGSHIWSNNEITVHQYDDHPWDWEMVILPELRFWATDYYYGGVFTFKLGVNHILVQAAYDNTNVNIDLDCDGNPEYVNTIDRKEVWDLSLDVIKHPDKTVNESMVGYDTRAGAHITSDKPVQIHVFAEHQEYFGSACNLIPTRFLGKEYFVPRINCTLPTGVWDEADEIIVVAIEPGITTVDIDVDLDCVPDVTLVLSGPCDWDHWPPDEMDDAWLNGAYVKADKNVAVFISSPGGGHHWDGFLSQMVPREATRQNYWNTVNWSTINTDDLSSAPAGWVGAPQIYIFAYEDGTTVNIDQNNDGIPDVTFNMDFKDGGVVYTPTKCGEHIWTTNPGKSIAVYQGWYYNAADVLTPISYTVPLPAQVPALTPIGIAALVGLLTIIATSVIVRKRKKR